MKPFSLQHALLPLLAGLVVLAVYWTGLHGEFFFDDQYNILSAGKLRIETLSVESLRQAMASGSAGPLGRPVAQLSFALNYYLGGFAPFAFKLTNLAIHLGCGLLVFLLARRILIGVPPQARGSAKLSAAILALAWLLHPIQLLAVLHVVQRMTSLSALFLFAGLYLHVAGRERGGRTGAANVVIAWSLLWPLACLSKENGLLFPLLVLAWEWILRARVVGRTDLFARILAVLVGSALTVSVVYLLLPAGQWLWAGYNLRPFTFYERLLTEGRVLWFYLGLILFPRIHDFGLYHDDIPISTGLLAPVTTLPALFGLAGLVGVAWWLRRRVPLASFGIAWFLIGHAIESTFLPLEIAHEHRNYLPLFGVLLVGAWWITQALERTEGKRKLVVAASVALLVLYSFLTGLRADAFGDELRRTQFEAQHHPGSARAQHEAGRILADLSDAAIPGSAVYAQAREHYEMAGRFDPSFKMNWLGLIDLSCKTGLPVEQSWIDELTRRLRSTPMAPADRNVLYSLKEMAIAGRLCVGRKTVEGMFTAALANPTTDPVVRAMLHSWFADFLALVANDLQGAQSELDRSLTIVPDNPSNQLKRAQLDFLLGHHADAALRLSRIAMPKLAGGEKETLEQLQNCLKTGKPEAGCVKK